MKIQYISDLHLEHESFRFEQCGADVIVLAGDIDTGNGGLAWASKCLPRVPIIYVLGNHEYYRHSFPQLHERLIENNSISHIHILNNDSLTIDGVNFFGTTLWTDFELMGDIELSKKESQLYMNDYHYIGSSDTEKMLTPDETSEAFAKSIAWLDAALTKHVGETNIVITHQAPSINSILPKYLGDSITAAFASDLDYFIAQHQPNIWIHGHVHHRVDYKIGNTRILCNPRGYPREESRLKFDPVASVNVGQTE